MNFRENHNHYRVALPWWLGPRLAFGDSAGHSESYLPSPPHSLRASPMTLKLLLSWEPRDYLHPFHVTQNFVQLHSISTFTISLCSNGSPVYSSAFRFPLKMTAILPNDPMQTMLTNCLLLLLSLSSFPFPHGVERWVLCFFRFVKCFSYFISLTLTCCRDYKVGWVWKEKLLFWWYSSWITLETFPPSHNKC